ncbi:MAG: stealth family protein, partial [Petrimonas sp.]|uniref:stealth family protein n=1 Tax=Petrimonas sp. TaxID=2023866 RepID=UPI002B383A5C|nr:stealth family protein [Petrimonas sp.]
MDSIMQPFDIDLVYLWVDGDDPKWLEKKRQFTGKVADCSEGNNKGRYVNNGELKYSLRSVEKYVPWIRRIYIVTDNQYPGWLQRDHPKIRIIDHTEILPEEALPCFNSSVIEYFIYKIPGLSEHFLLANDDMFFNKTLSPDYFFDKEGIPFVRLKRKFLGRWHYPLKRFLLGRQGQYISKVLDGASFVEKKFGTYYSGIPHHNVDAYVKSDYRYA